MPLLSFLNRGGLTAEERVDLQEYLRAVRTLTDTLDREYAAWLEVAADSPRKLSRERDPDGQHASVYLWRVGEAAREFVQRKPVKAAERYHESMSLCLEARAAAADLFKEAAGTGVHNNPGAKVGAANRKLVESERLLTRAREALRELDTRLAAR
jgi:hypothetical protein